ncbi:MAG: protein-disulfide reductase DsbD domain-containing protein [FCB group bacterium]|jgi:thiol:disulfide interchange protein DsbD
MKKYIVIILIILSFEVYAKEKDGSKLVKITISRYEESKEFTWLIFTIIPDKGYHTYWLNPGDAGLPTKIEFDSSTINFSIFDTLWQIPEKIRESEFASFGYTKNHIVVFKIKKKTDITTDNFDINVKISWLVCKEICIPGSKQITINYNKIRKISKKEFASFKSILPLDLPPYIKIKSIRNGEKIDLFIENNPMLNNKINDMTFYPYDEGYLNNGEKQEMTKDGKKIILHLTLDNLRNIEPKNIRGILVSSSPIIKDMPNKSIEINSEIFQNK